MIPVYKSQLDRPISNGCGLELWLGSLRVAALKSGIKRDQCHRIPSFAIKSAGSGVYDGWSRILIRQPRLSCAPPVLDGWNRMGDTVSSASLARSNPRQPSRPFPGYGTVRERSLSHHARFFRFLLETKGNSLVTRFIPSIGDQLAVLPLSRAISVRGEISW